MSARLEIVRSSSLDLPVDVPWGEAHWLRSIVRFRNIGDPGQLCTFTWIGQFADGQWTDIVYGYATSPSYNYPTWTPGMEDARHTFRLQARGFSHLVGKPISLWKAGGYWDPETLEVRIDEEQIFPHAWNLIPPSNTPLGYVSAFQASTFSMKAGGMFSMSAEFKNIGDTEGQLVMTTALYDVNAMFYQDPWRLVQAASGVRYDTRTFISPVLGPGESATKQDYYTVNDPGEYYMRALVGLYYPDRPSLPADDVVYLPAHLFVT